MKLVLLDWAGFNSDNFIFIINSDNSFEEIFNRVKPNTVLVFLAKINYKNMI